MGWNGGTILFDTVVEEMLAHNTPLPVVLAVSEALAKELNDMDWDVVDESRWWDDPEIGRVLGNTFDEENEDE